MTPSPLRDAPGDISREDPAGAARPVLELRGVVKEYGGVRAVAGVSLHLAPGEFLTLLGPSGCGKTTLMNLVAGFFPPSAGEILLDGRDVTSLKPHRRNLGMVFQSYALFPHMSVAENVAFGLEERRVPRPEIRRRVEEALTLVRLPGHGERRITQLSGGQQQRVALARALVIRPRVLLLDEPLSALDKNLRAQMQIEIKQIQREAGVAALFVTHDQGEALSLSDRIAVMNAGRVEQVDAPEAIYARPASRFVAGFVGEVNRIPARVTGWTPRALLLEAADGARLVREGADPAAITDPSAVTGGRVDVFVRPEDAVLVEPADGRDNVLAGTIVAQSYQGSFTHLLIQAGPGEPLLVKVPGAPTPGRHPVGARVGVALDLARATIHPAS